MRGRDDNLAVALRKNFADVEGVWARSSMMKLSGTRIVFVINSDSGGGVENLTKVLHAHVCRCGALASVFTVYPGESCSTFKKIVGLMSASFRVMTARADVVITFQPTSSVLAMVISRFVGCKVRIAHQSNLPDPTHWLPRWLDRFIGSCGFYSVNIVNSETTRAAFGDYPNSYRQRLHKIPHGVSWELHSKPRDQVRKSLGIPQDVSVLLSCARLSPGKSLDTIVRALPHLPQTHFVLAGEGPERDSLLRIAGQLNVSERVHFLGLVSRDQLADLFEAFDVFVFPSKRETFGLAPLEAAMSGLPIVASSIPAVREVLSIEGALPARFVSDWSEVAWANAIREVLLDPDIGVRAREFAPRFRERYSEGAMLERYDALFEELLA